MVMGRPRKYDLIEEARLLDEWSKLDDSLSLYEFTDLKEYCAQDLSRFASESTHFYESLKKAKERVGLRRERACSKTTMNYGVWNRNARVYDKMLKEHEDQDADQDAERKKSIESSKPTQVIVKVSNDGLGSGLGVST